MYEFYFSHVVACEIQIMSFFSSYLVQYNFTSKINSLKKQNLIFVLLLNACEKLRLVFNLIYHIL